MTMPNERTRALRWGYEVLQEIAEDPSVRDEQRSKAAEVLVDYPPPADVSRWIQEDVSSILELDWPLFHGRLGTEFSSGQSAIATWWLGGGSSARSAAWTRSADPATVRFRCSEVREGLFT